MLFLLTTGHLIQVFELFMQFINFMSRKSSIAVGGGVHVQSTSVLDIVTSTFLSNTVKIVSPLKICT